MTASPPSRQSLRFLLKRFEQAGIHPKTRFGQNFLVDLNLLEILAASADVGPDDVVLEVGTGTGALTALVAAQAAHVVSVEVDPQMHQLASEELIDRDNVTLLLQDALHNKNQLHPAVIEAVETQLRVAPRRRLKLVANLPYNVATPILSNLLDAPTRPVTMTATIQRELAERITAAPGTKDYSALSIWIQAQAEAEILRVLPPTVFWPRPKVESAFLQIRTRDDLRAQLRDPAAFHAFIRGLFCHRRKFLRGVLVSLLGQELTKAQIDATLEPLGFGPNARAEELDVPTMVRLHDAFAAARAAAAAAKEPSPG